MYVSVHLLFGIVYFPSVSFQPIPIGRHRRGRCWISLNPPQSMFSVHPARKHSLKRNTRIQ